MARRNRGLKLIGVPFEPDVHEAIVAISEAKDQEKPIPLAEVVRDLVRDALEDGAEERILAKFDDEGYQAGLRRGLHEVRQHMKKLYGSRE